MYTARIGLSLEPIPLFEEEASTSGDETRAVHVKGWI
jgi:hypothetical protein